MPLRRYRMIRSHSHTAIMAPVSNDKSIYHTTHVKIGMVNYFSQFRSPGYCLWGFSVKTLRKKNGRGLFHLFLFSLIGLLNFETLREFL